jgi:hypothetical protein
VSSGRRITVALVGLVLLAVIGWLATGMGHSDHSGDRHGTPTPVSTTAR